MDDTFFDKKWLGSGAVKSKNILNEQLAEELYNLIIRKFKNRKVHSSFMENILGADLADMQLIIKFNNKICFLMWY